MDTSSSSPKPGDIIGQQDTEEALDRAKIEKEVLDLAKVTGAGAMGVANVDSDVENQEPKILKITRVERFGIFLEDGGFIHISRISDYHKKRMFDLNEIDEWCPVGSLVLAKLEKKEKLLNDDIRITYYYLGPADVVDVEFVRVNSDPDQIGEHIPAIDELGGMYEVTNVELKPLTVCGQPFYDRPTRFFTPPKGHKVICGFDQGLGEKLYVCDTLEDMQRLYDAYAMGGATSISWYFGSFSSH